MKKKVTNQSIVPSGQIKSIMLFIYYLSSNKLIVQYCIDCFCKINRKKKLITEKFNTIMLISNTSIIIKHLLKERFKLTNSLFIIKKTFAGLFFLLLFRQRKIEMYFMS